MERQLKRVFSFFYVLILVTNTVTNTVLARVFVTHGFNGSLASWYQSGGDFYEALKKSAQEEGHSIEAFSWNQTRGLGYLTHEQRMAGLLLATKIIDFCTKFEPNPAYPNDHEVIVVAHSYGGLVSYYTSNFLVEFQQNTSALYPVKQHSFVSRCWQAITSVWKRKKTIAVPIIKKLFTMGTPHQETDPLPHTQGVHKIYNIYSTADGVASSVFAGTGTLPIALQKQFTNAYNIQLFGMIEAQFMCGLGHSEIHHPGLAEYLFDLSDYVDKTHATDDKHSKKARHIVYVIPLDDASKKSLNA